jgi:methionyl-tRNA formyltransferase
MKILLLAPRNEHTDKIKKCLISDDNEIFQAQEKIFLDNLVDLEIDYIISYGYTHIIKPEIIQHYKNKIINLHISYLPWNRGASPNFWSWFKNTPKGVTIHHIDKGIDTGDIIIQKEIEEDQFNEGDTLYTTYEKLQRTIVSLFVRNWNNIKRGIIKSKQQVHKLSTFHTKKQLEEYSFLLEKHGWNTPVKQIQEYGRKIYGRPIRTSKSN